MEHDLTILAGCTTVYLEDFEPDRPLKLVRKVPPSVEQSIERMLGMLEADLRLANLGAAWFPG